MSLGDATTPSPGTDADAVERLVALGREELRGKLRFEPGPGEPVAAVTVPVRLPGGDVLGTLCYDSPEGSGVDDDRRFLRVIARLMADQLDAVRGRPSVRGAATTIRRVLDRANLSILFQPIANLRTGRLVGVEALARFPGMSPQPPDRWFREAGACGLGVDLELLATRSALERLPEMPPDVYLSVNCSPSTVVSPGFAEVLSGSPLDRLVIEITEHAEVDDYGGLNAALTRFRDAGARLAIDDAGSGFASLRHILRMSPDIIKLDVSLTRGIDRDPVQRALGFSLAAFASAVEADVVAEGIETEAEFRALRFLQVDTGQGFYLGPPAPLPLPDVVDCPALSPTSAA